MKLSFLTLLPVILGVVAFLLLPEPSAKTAETWKVKESAPVLSMVPIIQNVGQFRRGTLFQSHSELGTVFFAQDALWLTILEPSSTVMAERDPFNETEEAESRRGVHLRLSFVGSNPDATIETSNPLTTSINYFRGDDLSQWKSDVPVWGAVRYRELYPGIDLEFSSRNGTPMRRFVIQEPSRAHPQDITLQIKGAVGIRVMEERIEIETEFGVYPFPFFEVVAKSGEAVTGIPTQINGETIQFPLTHKQRVLSSRPNGNPLLPSNLLYSTFLGGSGIDNGFAVEVDQSGAIIVAGTTESFDFPTTPGAFDPSNTGSNFPRDGFVTKFDSNGSTLIYSTYLQGNNTDEVYALEVDSSGSVYATGYTRSSNFPTTPNSPTPGFGGQVDAFALKLTPIGNALVYGILLGGTKVDFARDLALGNDGTVAIAGITTGLGFPVTPGAYDTSNTDENRDAFVTRIASDGSSLIYSTLLGGTWQDEAYGVALDTSGSAYVMGIAGSADFPTTPGAYDPNPIDYFQYFVTKFTSDGRDLAYSTIVHGVGSLLSTNDITVDQYGAAYVAAHVNTPSFTATAGAYDTVCGYNGMGCGNPQNYTDGILFKLNPDGSEMVYGTYLGGSGDDYARKVVVDEHGQAYVAGGMTSPEVQMTAGAYTYPPSTGAIWKMSADGSELLQLSRCYAALALTLQADDVAVCAGYSHGAYETTPNAYDVTHNGDADVTIARILLPAPATTATLSATGGGLTSNVDGTIYTFPANTFTETVVFTHAPRHPLSLPPVAPRITIGHTFVNDAIGSSGSIEPQQPYTLQIQYDPTRFSIEESSIRLFYWDGTVWQSEASAILDTTNNRITATPTQLGWWVVTGVPYSRYLPLIKH